MKVYILTGTYIDENVMIDVQIDVQIDSVHATRQSAEERIREICGDDIVIHSAPEGAGSLVAYAQHCPDQDVQADVYDIYEKELQGYDNSGAVS